MTVPPSARLKLARADALAQELNREVARYLTTHVKTWIRTQQHPIEVELMMEWGEPGEELGVLLGDVLTNARAALDHLAYSYAPSGNTYFPISTTAADYAGAKGQRSRLGRMTEQQKRHFDQFQPFQEDKGNARHPLLLLRDLVNQDKHRSIQAGAYIAESISMHLEDADGNAFPTLVLGIDPFETQIRGKWKFGIMSYPGLGATTPMFGRAEFERAVRFGEQRVSTDEVHAILDRVRTILDHFELVD